LLSPPGSTGPAGAALEQSGQYVMPMPVTSARLRYTRAAIEWCDEAAATEATVERIALAPSAKRLCGRNRGLVVAAG